MDSVNISDITDFRISIQKWNSEHVREYITETVKKVDIEKVVNGAKYLMLTPKQTTQDPKIPWKSIYVSSKKEFKII